MNWMLAMLMVAIAIVSGIVVSYGLSKGEEGGEKMNLRLKLWKTFLWIDAWMFGNSRSLIELILMENNEN